MTHFFKYEDAEAQVFGFEGCGEVKEYHIMIHVTNPDEPFSHQMSAMFEAYNQIVGKEFPDTVAIFKRYFLSDAANQADEILINDNCDCAKSIIEQQPLNSTKIALWAYLMTDVSTRQLSNELYEVSHGSYRHLWNGSACNLATNAEYQTRLLLNEYVMQLAQEGCTLADNCIRTWLFVNDIDNNYGGVVRARNQVFFTQGLTTDTHFIASTGIGGRQQNPQVLMQLDNYAIAGISGEQVKHLYAPTHLNRTSDYGVSFERGTRVDYGDRCHVFISGTASINNKGMVVHPRNVLNQAERMKENVEMLLKEAECTFEDVAQIIVYLRDGSDYRIISKWVEKNFKDTPHVIVKAAVCRQEWLIEMECIAVRKISDTRFDNF